jgi:diguanylate cyclase (GGDEF)-like protein
MLLRWYAVLSGALLATYLLWPYELRQWPFLIITGAALGAVMIALRRAPAGERTSWWVMLAALVLYNIGNVVWIWLTMVDGLVTGDGTIADLFFTAGGAFVLVSAILVVVRRGRRDVGGIIDSAITAVALGGVMWDALLLPVLTAHHETAGRQVSLFINVLALTGTLGAMLRVALTSGPGLASVRLFASGIAFALAGNVAAALTTDPATGLRPDWTNLVFLAGYAALGYAALHPTVAELIARRRVPEEHLTRGRMTFLGVMMALAPLIGGGRAMAGLPTDGILIALSSTVLIPLVMIRIARLSAQRRTAEEALRRLATRDVLTGLPNRAACLDRLDAELTAGPDDLAVLFGDLDGFKPVNDRLGHAAGDELLIAVAARLRGCVREGDLVSRFGGDEFVIVCRGADAVEVIGGRIGEMVRRPFPAGGEQVRIGVSMGVAHARPADSTDELLGRADLAMYEAKRSKSIGELTLVEAGAGVRA